MHLLFPVALASAVLGFADSKTLAVQIHLDRAGFSCSTIDGQWGAKSESALRAYEAERTKTLKPALATSPDRAYDRYFANAPDPFRIVEVTRADLDALVKSMSSSTSREATGADGASASTRKCSLPTSSARAPRRNTFS